MTTTMRTESPALDVLLRDGAVGQLRGVQPADVTALHALNARVSARTRMRRYFSAAEPAGRWYVDQVVQSARTGGGLVALVGGELVAVASFARTEHAPDEAELAVLVDDAHQTSGLGTLLLEHLADLARRRGVRTFVAEVLVDNVPMLHLLRDSGFTTVSANTSLGVTELRITLEDTPKLRDAVHHREAAAECASLTPVLAPRSVAVVGSSRPGSVADRVHESLRRSGYPGSVHRLRGDGGLRRLAVPVDLVVVAVPAAGVLEVAADAAAAGAKGLLVLSAGFAEEGPEGSARQRELVVLCRREGMRLIGPNCLGVVNTDPTVRLDTTFCDASPLPGGVALASQSGAVGIAALRHAGRRGTGLSLFVSTGNKADVSGNDLLCVFEADPRTKVVALYLESFGNPRRFARLAAAVGRTKPVVVLKSGRTDAGARAGASHTAAAATPDIAVQAMLQHAGVLRAKDLPQLFDLLTLLESTPLPKGRRVAVVGNSGGPGVLAADACADAGLQIAELSPETSARLVALSPHGAVGNPVDLLATVTPEVFEQAVAALAADHAVDAIVSVYTPLVAGTEVAYAEALTRIAAAAPDLPILATFPGLATRPEALGTSRVAFYEFPEPAATALGAVARYAEWRATPPPLPLPRPAYDREGARALLARAGADGWMPMPDTVALLRCYGVPMAEVVEAADPDAAARAAQALGYPVALKACGPTIVHKTDVGGVVLDLADEAAVRRAFIQMQERVGPAMTSAVVQGMHPARGALELIAGLTVDPEVGPLLLVGAGGVLTDVLDDRAVRVPPTSVDAALEQLAALRCAARFSGYRDQEPLDLGAVTGVLLSLAALAEDLPEVQELDLNPLLITSSGAVCVDARIRVGDDPGWSDLNTRALSP